MRLFLRKEKKKGENKPRFLNIGVFLFIAFFFSAINFLATSAASAPAIITYQGKLLDNNSPATTTLSMKFVIYDAATSGTALYTAAGTTGAPTTISVTPVNGLFSVDLGDTGTNALSQAIFQNNSSLFLEVTINRNGSDEVLSPRKRITAVPFAFNASFLNGVGTNTVSSSTYIPVSDSSGNFNFNGVTSTALYVSGNAGFGVQPGTLTTYRFGSSALDTQDMLASFGSFVNGGSNAYALDAEVNVSPVGAILTTQTAVNGLAATGNGVIQDMSLASLIGGNFSAYSRAAAGNTLGTAIGVKGDVANSSGNLSSAHVFEANGDIGGGTTTNYISYYAKNPTNIFNGFASNTYGMYIENLTTGSNTYGIYVDGAKTYGLWVNSGATLLGGALTVNGTSTLATTTIASSTINNLNVSTLNTPTVNFTSATGTNLAVSGLVNLNGAYINSAFMASGTTGNTPGSGAGTRMMWIPAKVAFRAGAVSGAQWDDAKIGAYSFAFGSNTTASGTYSAAIGNGSAATGNGAFAGGEGSVLAAGQDSFAFGNNSQTLGWGSVSMGLSTNATAQAADAFGYSTVAQGGAAFAAGWLTQANGQTSTAFGSKIIVSGNNSFGIGLDTTSRTLSQDNAMAIVGGNVGIGTLTPGYTLSVTGTLGVGGITSLATTTITNLTVTSCTGCGGDAYLANNQTFTGQNNFNATTTMNTVNITSSTITQLMFTNATGTSATTTNFFSSNLAFSNIIGNITASGTAGNVPTTFTTGTRFLWMPTVPAFRGGYVDNNFWDQSGFSNLGLESFSFGYDTNAKGNYSFSGGYFSSSTGDDSVAIGDSNLASQHGAVALGQSNKATQQAAVALGFGNTASGLESTAIGNANTASGNYSTAFGSSNQATGTYSFAVGNSNSAGSAVGGAVAMGYSNHAYGEGSVALGESNTASGDFSFVMGDQSSALGKNSATIGYRAANFGTSSIFMTLQNFGSSNIQLNASNTFAVAGGNMIVSSNFNGGVLVVPTTSYKLYVDTASSTLPGIGVNGYIVASGYVTGTSTLDLAETYPVQSDCATNGTCPVPGDAVCAVDSATVTIAKCTDANATKAIGIVSTDPGFTLGGIGNSNNRKVALAGRVPLKVSLKNGPINVGDRLAVSDIPGVAVKAVGVGPTIGIALEPLDGSTDSFGVVLTFVKISDLSVPIVDMNNPAMQTLSSTSYSETFKSLIAALIDALKSFGITIENGVARFGQIFASNVNSSEVDTQKLCVDDVCVTRDEFKQLIERNQITPAPITTQSTTIIDSTTTVDAATSSTVSTFSTSSSTPTSDASTNSTTSVDTTASSSTNTTTATTDSTTPASTDTSTASPTPDTSSASTTP